MGLWSWLTGRPEVTPQETWTLKRYKPHRLSCCVCQKPFYDGQIILCSNLGRFKHRGC